MTDFVRVPSPFAPVELQKLKADLEAEYLALSGARRGAVSEAFGLRRTQLRKIEAKLETVREQLDAHAISVKGSLGLTVLAASNALCRMPIDLRADMEGAWDTLSRAVLALNEEPGNGAAVAAVDSRLTIIFKVAEAYSHTKRALAQADEEAAKAPATPTTYPSDDLVTAHNLMEAMATGVARATQ